jgi:hypothetical protein
MGTFSARLHLVYIECTVSTPSERLRANLFLPWHIPSQRFLRTSIQEESDTAFLQDSSGVSVEIFVNPRTGHSTSATLRDVLLLNFPAVRDTHQLRALLSGTPLCEVHGSTRSGLHREGTLIDFAAAIMAIPYTGLFIAASCNSRSSHGQYTRSSTEHLQYGAVTSARLLGRNYSNRNHTDKVRQYVFRYTFLPTQNNGTSLLMTAHALNTSNRPAA